VLARAPTLRLTVVGAEPAYTGRMNYSAWIKEVARLARAGATSAVRTPRPCSRMLDGAVPDLELGALLIALRVKGERWTSWPAFGRDAGPHRPPRRARRPAHRAAAQLQRRAQAGPI
jgi:hypothetical protein